MSKLKDLPGDHVAQATIPVEATANAARSTPIFRAPANVTVTAVRWIPGAAVTGNTSNNFALQVVNKTNAGNVTAIKTYATGTDSVAHTAESLTLSTGVALAAGDVIALDRTITGTGLAGPAGMVEVTYRYR